MFNLESLFNDFFDEPQFSLLELVQTASDWVGRMTQMNPAGVFTTRSNALHAALANLEANTTDAGVKLALQKGATLNKKNFRKALQENMAKVQAKVVAQYGKKSAQLMEIFPDGLAPFSTNSPDDDLENKLGVVLAGVTAHTADLPGAVTDVGGYLSAWLVVYAASKGTKNAKMSTHMTGADLRKALQMEMTKTALFVAFTYAGDQAKGHYYLPTEHLFNPQKRKPVTPDIVVNFGAGFYDITATVANAVEVIFLAQFNGTGGFVEVGRKPPGEMLVVSSPAGTVEVKAFATNSAGAGPTCAVVSGAVT